MFDKLRIHGEQASLLWGYRTAATLSAWSITRDQAQWKLVATVKDLDTFQAAQRPLLLLVKHGQGQSRWLLEDVQIYGGSVKATLGPPAH